MKKKKLLKSILSELQRMNTLLALRETKIAYKPRTGERAESDAGKPPLISDMLAAKEAPLDHWKDEQRQHDSIFSGIVKTLSETAENPEYAKGGFIGAVLAKKNSE